MNHALANVKAKEQEILAFVDSLAGQTDPRWLAIARTDFQKSFMFLTKALFANLPNAPKRDERP